MWNGGCLFPWNGETVPCFMFGISRKGQIKRNRSFRMAAKARNVFFVCFLFFFFLKHPRMLSGSELVYKG